MHGRREAAADWKILWTELWRSEQHRIKFFIQSVYDVLPSPSNLLHWGWAETPLCSLCQKAGSLEHILNCCLRALGDGCYRWRHEQVLQVIAEVISTWITPSKHQQPTRQSQQPRSQAEGLLATAQEWQLMVDLGRQFKFPENIVVTTLGPRHIPGV